MLSKNPHEFFVVHGVPVPKVVGRGHPHGKGRNIDLLKKMGAGDSIWQVPMKKMLSIKNSAWSQGIAIRIRKAPPPMKGYIIFKI